MARGHRPFFVQALPTPTTANWNPAPHPFPTGLWPWRDMLAVGCAVLPGFGPGGAGLSSGMAPFDPEPQPIPVRGCISVARDGCARGPNPREGIHGSPRITRICTCNVCGILRYLRAICSAAGHRWFFDVAKVQNFRIESKYDPCR